MYNSFILAPSQHNDKAAQANSETQHL